MRASAALVLFALSAGMTAVGEPQPEPNPDFPPTEIRFGWLRQEHQHPDQPSPRPQPKHDKLIPNGRIMYLRWDYTNTPHCFNRVVLSMNPDGTDQAAMYGSNSYWPNGTFYPKVVPGSSTKFVGIVSPLRASVFNLASAGKTGAAGLSSRTAAHSR